MYFSPYLGNGCGGGGGGPKGLVHNLLMQLFTQLKNQSFRNLIFFDIVTTQNDYPGFSFHVLARIYVVLTPILGVCCSG